jgi:Flp pilus assembly protein TadG
LVLRRWWRNEAGATAVEFALVAPCVMLLMFSLIEIGVLAFMSVGLDNALQSAARTVRTGQLDGPATATAFKTSICDRVLPGSSSCAAKLSISVRRFTSFASLETAASDPPGGEFDRGQAGDIMLVKATLRWPLLTPLMDRVYRQAGGGEVLLDSRAVFKNEPYT